MMLCVEVKMESTKILDIIAYYLSEYDNLAFDALGYKSHKQGFDSIAPKFGKKESYLRRLRDEYDVVTSSHRNGQCNRPPRTRIVETAQRLKEFSFRELSEIVKALIDNTTVIDETVAPLENSREYDIDEFSEEEIEYIVNFKDTKADVKVVKTNQKRRIYNTTIIKQLKNLYQGKCQLCGTTALPAINADICEIHHIDYFSSSHNNDATNLIVLCPNHHRIIHKLNPIFNLEEKEFVFENGKRIKIVLDYHLGGE